MSKIVELLHVFANGLGLKTVLSYVPPIGVAWTFFVLYLLQVRESDPQGFRLALLLGLSAIAIGSVIVVLLILSTVPPLRRLVRITHRMEQGETELGIPYASRHDEIGELAHALETFRKSMKTKVELQEEQKVLQKKSEDQRRRVSSDMAKSFTLIFEGIITGLQNALNRQEKCADRLTTSVTTAGTAAQEVFAAVRESSAALSSVSNVTNELNEKNQLIGQQADESHKIAQAAVDGVRQTKEQADILKEAALNIGNVVSLISKIAEQTNLLALNATIEAARAGEVGKGFAVVASEVKLLANQTSAATKQISDQVTAIQSSIGIVVTDVNAIVSTIDRSLEISEAIAKAVDAQLLATTHISESVKGSAAHAAKAEESLRTLQSAAQHVESATSETATATKTCQQECSRMQDEVNDFTRKAAQG